MGDEIDEIAAGSFKQKDPSKIIGSGYVVKSLEAATWAFYRSRSFREGALLAVNLGNDADTTGAVYGQIAGAYYGNEGIPEEWRSRFAQRTSGGRPLIPRAHITAWRAVAPWPSDVQIEQDLILSRALIDMFRQPAVAEALAFRGGSALHKLFLNQAGRYSEDIDLVQVGQGPIGPALDSIRGVLDPWLGAPRRNQGAGRVTMLYRFETTSKPVQRMRLKVEINTREHFAVFGFHRQ